MSASCPGGAANGKGVGKPCASATDCAGLAASLCPVADMHGDLDFCTLECTVGFDVPCGDGARCVGQGPLAPKCVPASCGSTLDRPQQFEKAVDPCEPGGTVNDTGLGKPCKTRQDCLGLIATNCPVELHDGLADWCSFLCDGDADCHDAAWCWKRPSVEGGLVGSCEPLVCRIYPGVRASCSVGPVNGLGVGRKCSSDTDCAGQPAAGCGPWGFCSRTCSHDDDCGRNAHCAPHDADGKREFFCVPILCELG